jgi:hypothetical protein
MNLAGKRLHYLQRQPPGYLRQSQTKRMQKIYGRHESGQEIGHADTGRA